MPSRPLIGLNSTCESDADGPRSIVRAPYWQAILQAGGLPVLLPQLSEPDDIREAAERLHGFVLIGGNDIGGEAWGAPTLPTVVPVETPRVRADSGLLGVLIEREIPTLALCLGFQQLNVARGGTLYQDLLFDGPTSAIRHYAKSGPAPVHSVEVERDSLLARATEEARGGGGSFAVNSVHHQGIAEVGEGLRVSARAPDGLVEALELPGHRFCLGVQWHPERLTAQPVHAALFAALVKEASPG